MLFASIDLAEGLSWENIIWLMFIAGGVSWVSTVIYFNFFSSGHTIWSDSVLQLERRYRIIDRRTKRPDIFLLEDWLNGNIFWCEISALRDVADPESTEFAMKSAFPDDGVGVVWLPPEKTPRELARELHNRAWIESFKRGAAPS